MLSNAKHDQPTPSNASTTTCCQSIQSMSNQRHATPGMTQQCQAMPRTTTHRQPMLNMSNHCHAMEGTATQCRSRPTNVKHDQCQARSTMPSTRDQCQPPTSTPNQCQARPGNWPTNGIAWVAGPQADLPWNGWVYQWTPSGHWGRRSRRSGWSAIGPPLEWRAHQWGIRKGEGTFAQTDS